MKNRPRPLEQSDFFQPITPDDVCINNFPKTRYQGSKRRLLYELFQTFSGLRPSTAIDLYSGTATVSLLLRSMGWRVVSNDYMMYNNATARTLMGSFPDISQSYMHNELEYLINQAPISEEMLVSNRFQGIYFSDEENIEIDRFCQNVRSLHGATRDLYIYAVGQALLMKRPYNLFHRANLSMRTRSVPRSFGNAKTWNTPIITHAVKIIKELERLLRGSFAYKGVVTNQNTLDLSSLPDIVNLVYLDPPYLNAKSVSVNYCSFYHFLEGLCEYELYAACNYRYPHRPIVDHSSAWNTEAGALDELSRILTKWPLATIALSYRSDGKPEYGEICQVFRDHGRGFETVGAHEFKYALSHESGTKEMVLISKPR